MTNLRNKLVELNKSTLISTQVKVSKCGAWSRGEHSVVTKWRESSESYFCAAGTTHCNTQDLTGMSTTCQTNLLLDRNFQHVAEKSTNS